jgi:SAM-dependent methyltransferase
MSAPGESWNRATSYEPYVGRWSRLVATEFVRWLDVHAGCRWLDVGCGTGAVSHTVLAQAAPVRLEGVDVTAAYVEHVRTQVGEDARAAFRVGDAQDLPFDDEEFDAAVSGLVLNFVSEPGRAVAEMTRVARPGGVVAAYVWDYAGRMELMRYLWDGAIALDGAARDLDEGRRFPLCQPAALDRLWRQAQLQAVAVRAIDTPTVFRDFDDYWSPFLGGQGPAPGYVMSLPEERRTALRDHIRDALPVRADGSIHLVARAWAVRGTKAAEEPVGHGWRPSEKA